MSSLPQPRRVPYAPPATVLSVIHHFRQRELPEALSDTLFGQIGVKDSVLLIVKQALVFLSLLREDGTTTDNFRALRFASDEDRLRLFRELVTAAYSEILAIHDPEAATRGQLYNAFRPYSPASQHDRMITFFLAMCQEAGFKIAQPPRQSQVAQGPTRLQVAKTASARQGKAGQRLGHPQRQDPAPNGLLFGVSEADIAKLSEDEFDEVWAALGKVARARARVTTRPEPAENGTE